MFVVFYQSLKGNDGNYEKWKTHVRDVRSRLKHKCKLATIRPSKEGGRKKGEKRRKENVAVTSI